ncbi:hypothetical protein EON62_05720 [archaeon]|nr:MAG: hypothetical protein EON62_05720 [archaeon]
MLVAGVPPHKVAHLFEELGVPAREAWQAKLADALWLLSAHVEAAYKNEAAAIAERTATAPSDSTQLAGASLDAWLVRVAAPRLPATVAQAWARLGELLLALTEAGCIKERMAQERLDLEVLAAAGIINNKDVASKQILRVSTRMHYTQTKFNLFAEENEGYAKLATALVAPFPTTAANEREANTGGSAGTTASAEAAAVQSHLTTLVRTVQALIGYFSLDPNRVFDILIDAAQQHDAHPAFIERMFDGRAGM